MHECYEVIKIMSNCLKGFSKRNCKMYCHDSFSEIFKISFFFNVNFCLKGLPKRGNLPSELLQVFLSTGILWARLLKEVDSIHQISEHLMIWTLDIGQQCKYLLDIVAQYQNIRFLCYWENIAKSANAVPVTLYSVVTM